MFSLDLDCFLVIIVSCRGWGGKEGGNMYKHCKARVKHSNGVSAY